MFTPVDTALGAVLLHQGSSGLLQHNGRVFGISSLLSGSVAKPSRDNLPIVGGLISSIIPVYYFAPSLLPTYLPVGSSWEAALATLATGFAVGWGTKNECGCTSGHMLCGLSRLSPRSAIATGIFFMTALITANIRNTIPACPNNQPCYSPTYPTPRQAAFMVGAVMLAQLTNSILVPRMLQKSKNSTTIYSYIAGLQFGLGLFITGMANPAKVLGFFSWFDRSKFDPSLSLVMLFAVIPNLISYMKLGAASGDENGKKRPTLADMFQLPTATMADIDWRFVAGGVAFGVGWGLSGVCPGPGLLRTVLQPKWGLLWMGGYMLGALSGL
ncbi:YeeE/YedE family integral membrane protein [Histoplasma capsulatum var. duboisii H88]|uniref:YeeE/YedE family integral membrane protein n=1 Tax=Ajellomyces capsulatus (strain H88) TaxID=544711 RepID=A0A8A1LEZ2_AJEC8|nr:YeeE/YedE family integral membrane protein [Histoplasma capsulatum var. duboisii H88]